MCTPVKDFQNTWNINVKVLKSMKITLNRIFCLYLMK